MHGHLCTSTCAAVAHVYTHMRNHLRTRAQALTHNTWGWQNGVNIMGTTPEKIDNAEDRQKHSAMLDDLGIDQPAWSELKKMEDAFDFCRKVCIGRCFVCRFSLYDVVQCDAFNPGGQIKHVLPRGLFFAYKSTAHEQRTRLNLRIDRITDCVHCGENRTIQEKL
jgi:hypothetical protein